MEGQYKMKKRNKNEELDDYKIRAKQINKERRLRKKDKARSIK